MKLEVLGLSARSYNALRRAGINTVDDLLKLDDSQLIEIRNLGIKSFSEIKEVRNSVDFNNLNNEVTEIKDEKPKTKIKIDKMDLSVRSYNCLKRAGINTLYDLLALSDNQLRNIRNLGTKSYNEIKVKISDLSMTVITDKAYLNSLIDNIPRFIYYMKIKHFNKNITKIVGLNNMNFYELIQEIKKDITFVDKHITTIADSLKEVAQLKDIKHLDDIHSYLKINDRDIDISFNLLIGFTQKELSKTYGVTQSYVSRIKSKIKDKLDNKLVNKLVIAFIDNKDIFIINNLINHLTKFHKLLIVSLVDIHNYNYMNHDNRIYLISPTFYEKYNDLCNSVNECKSVKLSLISKTFKNKLCIELVYRLLVKDGYYMNDNYIISTVSRHEAVKLYVEKYREISVESPEEFNHHVKCIKEMYGVEIKTYGDLVTVLGRTTLPVGNRKYIRKGDAIEIPSYIVSLIEKTIRKNGPISCDYIYKEYRDKLLGLGIETPLMVYSYLKYQNNTPFTFNGVDGIISLHDLPKSRYEQIEYLLKFRKEPVLKSQLCDKYDITHIQLSNIISQNNELMTWGYYYLILKNQIIRSDYLNKLIIETLRISDVVNLKNTYDFILQECKDLTEPLFLYDLFCLQSYIEYFMGEKIKFTKSRPSEREFMYR